MPPWQQLHPSSSGLTSGVGSSGTASSNTGSSSPRMVGTSSSPVNTLADASSGVTTNLLMDSTNTNCNGNDKTSGRTATDSSKNPYRTKWKEIIFREKKSIVFFSI